MTLDAVPIQDVSREHLVRFVEEAVQDLRETMRPFEPGRVAAVGDDLQPAPDKPRRRVPGVADR